MSGMVRNVRISSSSSTAKRTCTKISPIPAARFFTFENCFLASECIPVEASAVASLPESCWLISPNRRRSSNAYTSTRPATDANTESQQNRARHEHEKTVVACSGDEQLGQLCGGRCRQTRLHFRASTLQRPWRTSTWLPERIPSIMNGCSGGYGRCDVFQLQMAHCDQQRQVQYAAAAHSRQSRVLRQQLSCCPGNEQGQRANVLHRAENTHTVRTAAC